MGLKELTNITDAQLKAYGVSSLATKPNAPSTYGSGGLTAEELKARFDSLGKLLAKAINATNTALSTDGANYISLEIGEEIKSLADLTSSYLDGTFANVLKAYEKATDIGDTEKLKTLQAILSGFSQRLVEVENVGDATTLSSAKDYADTQDTTNLANAKTYADTQLAEFIETAPETFATLQAVDGMAVKYNKAQSLTELEKAQARSNIGADGSADNQYMVRVIEQTFTETEKAQARTNIGAVGEDIKDTVTTFVEASTRANIATGEKTSTIFGKIKKWFADLKPHAFNDLATVQGTETDKAPTNKLFTDTVNSIVPVSSIGSVSGGLEDNGDYVFLESAFGQNWSSATYNIVIYAKNSSNFDMRTIYLEITHSSTADDSTVKCTAIGTNLSLLSDIKITYSAAGTAQMKVYFARSGSYKAFGAKLISAEKRRDNTTYNFINETVKTTVTNLGHLDTVANLLVGSTFDKTSISTVMPISSAAASNEKVLSEKVVYDGFATKTMPLLWEGGFSSGSIAVAGISNYKMIVVDVDSGGIIPLTAMRSGNHFIGGGNYYIATFAIDMTVSGDTVTYGTCSYIEHNPGEMHGGKVSDLQISKIWGVI